jgi:hypothetical protein
MLHRFLETIQAGEVQSLLEIAHKMGVSPDMVLQMAKELTSRGYLQEIGADCGEHQEGCPDCSVSSTCQVIVRHWFLTERGRTAISTTAKSI